MPKTSFGTSPVTTALPILRISVMIFMLIWSVEKLVRPDVVGKIYGMFYGLTLTEGVVIGIGLIQTAVILAFGAGLFRTVTYGLVLLMSTATMLITYKQILAPYEGPTNHLFAASIPVFGACLVLFLLREQDSKISLRKWVPGA